MSKSYKPGQSAPRSGQYEQIGPRGGRTGTERTVVRGEPPHPQAGHGVCSYRSVQEWGGPSEVTHQGAVIPCGGARISGSGSLWQPKRNSNAGASRQLASPAIISGSSLGPKSARSQGSESLWRPERGFRPAPTPASPRFVRQPWPNLRFRTLFAQPKSEFLGGNGVARGTGGERSLGPVTSVNE